MSLYQENQSEVTCRMEGMVGDRGKRNLRCGAAGNIWSRRQRYWEGRTIFFSLGVNEILQSGLCRRSDRMISWSLLALNL